jgi:hypothetical protein
MNQAKNAFGYVVKMQLTLAPDRSAMAGKVWTSLLGPLDGEGQDIVLVRYPAAPLPPATVCSGGDPSGACFLRPLHADRIVEPRVVKLSGGSLLLLWMNQRGLGARIASARFDAAVGAWQEAEFLDDGSASVDSPVVKASPGGWAMAVYRQGKVLVTRAYDPEQKAWTKSQTLVVSDDPSSTPYLDTLLVYDGGDATLIASVVAADGSSALSARDYVAKTGLWNSPHLFSASANLAPSEWAAASDSARNALVTWVEGGVIGAPMELWFSSRSATETWTDPAVFYVSDKQILRPAAAVDKDGTAIVTWQEFLTRIASRSFSFTAGAWAQPLTITSEQDIDNREVAFSDAGSTVADLHRNGVGEADEKSELANGVWGALQPIPDTEIDGTGYSVTVADDVQVTPIHPRAGESVPPKLARPRCDGY